MSRLGCKVQATVHATTACELPLWGTSKTRDFQAHCVRQGPVVGVCLSNAACGCITRKGWGGVAWHVRGTSGQLSWLHWWCMVHLLITSIVSVLVQRGGLRPKAYLPVFLSFISRGRSINMRCSSSFSRLLVVRGRDARNPGGGRWQR